METGKPTPSEMLLYARLNDLQGLLRKRSDATFDLARASSDMFRERAWLTLKEVEAEIWSLSAAVAEAWDYVKDGVVEKAVGRG